MSFFLKQPLYKRALVLYLLFSFTMSSGTVNGLQVALPQIMEDFDVPVTTAAWVGIAYFVALAGGTLTLGALTKIYDGRSLVILGLVADVVVMTITFFTNDIYVFIVCRFISPLVRVFPWLVLQVESVSGFPQEERGKAVGYTLVSQNLGLLVSLPLTGWVVDHIGWRWMFMGSSVVFALMVPLVLMALPPLKPAPAEKKRLSDFDMAGGILMMAGTVALITSLQLFARGMSNASLILILGVGGALALAAFVWIELHIAQPVLRFSLFRDPSVLTGSAQAAMVGWLTGVSILLLPFLFIDGFGWSVAHASNVLLFQNLARPLAGPAGGRLADRFGTNAVILPAAGITVIGQLGLVAGGVSPGWVVVAGVLLLWGTGLALMQTVNLSQIYAALPRNEMHVAPSLNLVVSTFGTTSGQAIGSLLVDRIGNATDTGADFASGILTAIVGIGIAFVAAMAVVQLLPRLLRSGSGQAAEVREPASGN
jgi:predicted MFS family arabinose efflux permease